MPPAACWGLPQLRRRQSPVVAAGRCPRGVIVTDGPSSCRGRLCLFLAERERLPDCCGTGGGAASRAVAPPPRPIVLVVSAAREARDGERRRARCKVCVHDKEQVAH